jgi:hypothetical protein
LEIDPFIYRQLIVNRSAKNIHWRMDNPFNKYFWENWISAHRRMKLDFYLSPLVNITLKWIKQPGWEHALVILATREVEIGGSQFEAAWVNNSKTLSQNNSSLEIHFSSVSRFQLVRRQM